ncbi:Mating-type switching protein swi10 [Entamoeba marina]
MSKQTPIYSDVSFSIRAQFTQKRNKELVERIRKNIRYDSSIKDSDFILANDTLLYFLTYSYHKKYPNYIDNTIISKINKIKGFTKFIVLFVVDSKEFDGDIISNVNMKIFHSLATLIVVSNYDDAARYIENISRIQIKTKPSQPTTEKYQVINALSMIRSISAKEANDLLSQTKKADNVYNVFHVPFIKSQINNTPTLKPFFNRLRSSNEKKSVEKKESNSQVPPHDVIVLD